MHLVTAELESGGLKANITVGGTYAEVDGSEARMLAQTEAVKLGVPRAGLMSQSGPYPVDAAGVTDEDLITGKKPVMEYRQDFVCAGI